MTHPHFTKRVLTAIAQALPDDGHGHLTRLDIWRGWGDILNVRVHISASEAIDRRGFADDLRGLVGKALGDERHAVEIVWEAPR